MAISDLPSSEIANYLHEHPETARALLSESQDKRFTPSSFISEEADGFRVGWLTRDAKCKCVQKFTDLPDAATDYLLFSLGKGRLTARASKPQELADRAERLLSGSYGRWDVDDYEHLNPKDPHLRELWHKSMMVGGLPEKWVRLDETKKDELRDIIRNLRRLGIRTR